MSAHVAAIIARSRASQAYGATVRSSRFHFLVVAPKSGIDIAALKCANKVSVTCSHESTWQNTPVLVSCVSMARLQSALF